MKKLIVTFAIVFVFTATLYNICCEEVLLRIDPSMIITASGEVKKNTADNVGLETETEQNKSTVRIVILSNNYQSKYHSYIKLCASGMKVYFGKKYQKSEQCKAVNITNESRLFAESNVVKCTSEHTIKWKNFDGEDIDRTYKGDFYIYKEKEGMVAVNEVDTEDYVAAVISGEIGENAPMEALKAQAVCARTYIKKSASKIYKKYNAIADDSTSFQVYNKEKPGKRCALAAEQTRNQVMTYNGKLISAYYFSTSCGFTTDYSIWGSKKLLYLEGKNFLEKNKIKSSKANEVSAEVNYNPKNETDFRKIISSNLKAKDSGYPFYRWNTYLDSERLKINVENVTGDDIGTITKINVDRRGAGGIVGQICVYGTGGKAVFKNQNMIRKIFCSEYAKIYLKDGSVRTGMKMLPSAFFYIENKTENNVLSGIKIYGGGYGHGSGMSQNGAKKMAEDGDDYKKILKSYYSGIEIEEK